MGESYGGTMVLMTLQMLMSEKVATVSAVSALGDSCVGRCRSLHVGSLSHLSFITKA